MGTGGSSDNAGTPTRPYLLRALHEWCVDNGFTPFIAVHVDASVQVPAEHVKNHEIVLNIGFDATSGLKLGNEFIEFKARFRGVQREIVVPVDHVVAIYARENGQGMAFPMPAGTGGEAGPSGVAGQPPQAAPAGAAVQPVQPPAASAPRGRSATPPLRLARQEVAPAGGLPAAPRGPASGPAASPSPAGPAPTPPPPDPGAPRPSLKRIK
ncbi:MAG: ClpXP protease specificity-enhancing factor [Rubrivivax sp.]|nr:ClpXP protease specificity-enhancing factor [Rubrivivax sp.]